MMNEEPQACAICSQQPEDMLILSCRHHLCLDCATELFAASRSSNSLQCEICTSVTPLDAQTVQCLSSLACEQQQQHPPAPVTPPSLPRPQSASRSHSKLLVCPQHQEEGLYFCFDCNHARICSECILEQTHLRHNVLTIKKSLPLLAEHLNSHTAQLQKTQQALTQEQQQLQHQHSQQERYHGAKLHSLKEVFDDIVKQANERYNQLTHEVNNCHQRSSQMIEGRLNQINSQLSLIQETIQQQNSLIDKERPHQTIVNFTKTAFQREQALRELPEQNISCPQVSLVVPSQTMREVESLLWNICWQSHESEEEKMQQPAPLQENHYQLANQPSIGVIGPIVSHLKPQWQQWEPMAHPNRSIDNYSGIKNTSRKLELSRSMHNATNIINRLQARSMKE